MSALVIAAGALATAGCSSSSSSSSSSSHGSGGGLTAKQIAFGSTLKHAYQPGKTESLSKPDDLVSLGGHLYVAFQNGVDSKGEPANDGNTNSTIVSFTPSGSVVKQWDVKGKIDGLGTDPATGQVLATVNEDGNSSLYAVSPSSATATQYTYSAPLPHKGGTDSIAYYDGKLLIAASAPGTSGKAPASAPAVYTATLKSGTATLTPFFAGNASAADVSSGKTTALALTDPDSSGVVPSGSPSFAGDYVLDSQADQQLIFSGSSGKLSVLKLSQSVDDSAWATSSSGTLYATDATSNAVVAITGSFTPGTVYTAETPCGAANAPSTCPAPGFPDDSLGTVNLKTGAVSKVSLPGSVNPKGLIFVP